MRVSFRAFRGIPKLYGLTALIARFFAAFRMTKNEKLSMSSSSFNFIPLKLLLQTCAITDIIKIMEKNKLSSFDHKTFIIFALFWVILGWLGFLSALFGIFYKAIFAAYFFFGAGLLTYFIVGKKIISRLSFEFRYALLLSLLITTIFSFFATPTIFSGRDQGSIAEAATRLSQNHRLKFTTPVSRELFKIYGPGKALNFPGFYYDAKGNLATQFPLAYTAWLGIFYSLFGLGGLVTANVILLFLFFSAFYFLSRQFLKIPASAAALIISVTSFSFMWFFKYTLSENMALALLWIGVLGFIFFLREKNNLYFFSMALTFGLIAFTRVEGFAFLLMAVLILFIDKDARKFLLSEKYKRIFFPVLALVAVLIIDFFVNSPFFKEMGKAALKIFDFLPKSGKSIPEKYLNPAYRAAGIFFAYGILQYLILGIIGIGYFLKKKRVLEIIPFVVSAPAFIYLIDSNISSDHPWMLRRYVFAIIPALIFYTVLFMDSQLKEKKKIIFAGLIIILTAMNIPSFAKYLIFSENDILLAQTKELSQQFSGNDLILVDRLASGDGWSMITGPASFLFGKNAVYFFNPPDLKKINTQKFDKIYLVVPDNNSVLYDKLSSEYQLVYANSYSLSANRLKIPNRSEKNYLGLPEIVTSETDGKIYEIIK